MTKAEKELKFLFAELSNYNPTTDEYKNVLDRIQKLTTIVNEEKKLKNENEKISLDEKAKEFDQELKEAQVNLERDKFELQKTEQVQKAIESKKERRSRFVTSFLPAILSLLGTIGTSILFLFGGLYSQKCEMEGNMTSRTANKLFDKTKSK